MDTETKSGERSIASVFQRQMSQQVLACICPPRKTECVINARHQMSACRGSWPPCVIASVQSCVLSLDSQKRCGKLKLFDQILRSLGVIESEAFALHGTVVKTCRVFAMLDSSTQICVAFPMLRQK